jgi:hypothetical protein
LEGLRSSHPGISVDVQRARWTYEVPKAGSGSTGLEEYLVEASSGTPAGKVMTVLRKGNRVYLAIETGTPPFRRDLHAVPWEAVEGVDHASLTVRLHPSVDVERALLLDPEKGIENGPAEAVRTDPPDAPPLTVDAGSGPADRAESYALTFALAAVGLLALLAVVVLASLAESTGLWALLVLPVALLLGALVSGYRLFRRPYEGTRG